MVSLRAIVNASDDLAPIVKAPDENLGVRRGLSAPASASRDATGSHPERPLGYTPKKR